MALALIVILTLAALACMAVLAAVAGTVSEALEHRARVKARPIKAADSYRLHGDCA